MVTVNKSKVVIPQAKPGGLPRIYPWHDLDVDDWFDAPLVKRASIVSSFGRFRPKRFTTRKIDETTVRVWRIA